MLIGLLIHLIIINLAVRSSLADSQWWFIWHDRAIPVKMELIQFPTGPKDFELLCLDNEVWCALVDLILNFLSSMIRLVYPSIKPIWDVFPLTSLNSFSNSLSIPYTDLQKICYLMDLHHILLMRGLVDPQNFLINDSVFRSCFQKICFGFSVSESCLSVKYTTKGVWQCL